MISPHSAPWMSVEAGSAHVGCLLARTDTSDVVDGHVARIAADGDRLLTSDASDLESLLAAAGTTAAIDAI